MQDNIRYCDVCARRLTPEDFAIGDAIEKRGRVYCLDCAVLAPHTTKQRPAVVPKTRRPSSSSARLRAMRHEGGRKHRVSSRRLASTRIVPKHDAPFVVEKKPTESTPPLILRVICPYCGEKFLLEDPGSLRDFVCPACERKMRLKHPRPDSGRQA